MVRDLGLNLCGNDRYFSGYQSEFLTYVKRTGNLPSSPARTTSRYGRPLGSSTFDRRTGFVEFAPAARKFPDNSPLNEDGTWKVNARDTPNKGEESDVKAPAAQQQLRICSPPEKTETQLAFGGAGFTSNSFYRKDHKMKDRDLEDAQSSASDTTGRTSELDAERRHRRISPVAALCVEDKSSRGDSNHPVVAAVSIQKEPHGNGTQRNGDVENSDISSLASGGQQTLESKTSDKKLDDKHNSAFPAGRPKRNIIPKSMVTIDLV